jgi:hypothetical protein
MKQGLLRLFTVFLLSMAFQTVFSQQIDSVMNIYAEQFPTEKMHIHFDKKIYNREETVWYKIYLLSGTELSPLSKNVYVEWYDTTGKMIKQTVAPLFQSTAKGSFDIPADYIGNYIKIKAFTRWMLNDDSVFTYERELTINNPSPSITKKPVILKTKVETFPEGGMLVNGLTTQIAFKATNQYGLPVFIKGFLVNDKNKVLDTLHVKHDGMGSFILVPKADEKYQLNWTDENGKTGISPIIVNKTEGARISIKTTNDKALVQVERTKGTTDNFKKMNLLVHMNQVLMYKISLNASEKTFLNAEVPIEELPTGVLQFTLFTSDWIPVAERLVFINNRLHEFSTKVVPQLVSLERRGKNVIDISVSDTAFTNMSVAITDATVLTPDEHTIYSDLVLSSEIRGKIYNPAYYLSSDADSVTANLDLLMLTNGWRRFDWDKVKAGILPTYKYPVETELIKITGKVFGMKSISSANQLLLNLIMVNKDSSKQFLFLPVNKDGTFEQKTFFYDTAKIYYSFNGNEKLTDNTQVKFENGLLRQEYKKLNLPDAYRPVTLSDSLAKLKLNNFLNEQEQLKRRMASATLQEVIVKSRVKTKEQKIDEKYASGLFAGGDAQTFDMIDDPSAMSALDIFSYLQGKVAGLMINGSGSTATLSWRGATPDVYVNEMSYTMDMVSSVNIKDIAMIKVFRPPFFGSMGGGSGGAIAIYTKKGNDGRSAPANAKGLENTILGGYSRFKEYYMPQYDKPTEAFETDIRTTVYWNPYILTNKKNPRVRIQFFNNDFSKKLQLVLEGVNGDGKMTRVVKMIE